MDELKGNACTIKCFSGVPCNNERDNEAKDLFGKLFLYDDDMSLQFY